ncbi:hypothetical protein PIGHUM_01097 [Pigmentiphaga humi]|uniref:Uncharacterized protein n=1 Tax=Pigmentiphaga humi TaxID=2478468 RepID=A0A3P4AYB8_9BURK|nr:hypothetical protein [Pigmentiphaga humi]VCU69037.1 hypothetical protein PIGHUM_01097 [Pigmentiphaga humi]
MGLWWVVLALAGAIGGIAAWRRRSRRQRRLYTVATRGGSLCVKCGRYVRPHARYCSHCLTEQPRGKAPPQE